MNQEWANVTARTALNNHIVQAQWSDGKYWHVYDFDEGTQKIIEVALVDNQTGEVKPGSGATSQGPFK